MIKLQLDKSYYRYNSILYCEGIPIVKFKQSFCDFKELTIQGVIYMQKYINANKNLCEIMKQDKRIKRFFFDVETTGTNFRRCSIHQLSYIIEIDGVIIEEGDLRMRPHEKALIEPEAMQVGNVTEEQIRAYPDFKEQFKVLQSILLKYVDKYDKTSKFFMIGFKNASFDDDYLKKLFDLCDSKFFLYFYPSSIDVSVLAAQYLIYERGSMPSFKLKRVAMHLGIEVDASKLHDANYDTYLTREIYRIITGTDLI